MIRPRRSDRKRSLRTAFGIGLETLFMPGDTRRSGTRERKTTGPGMYSISTRSWSISLFAIGGLLQVAWIPATCGQVLQTDRFEVPVQNRSEIFDVAPSTDSGLFLYRQFAGAKEDQIQLIKLDT